jgi:transcriptional regulator with XRE-family HTH domain
MGFGIYARQIRERRRQANRRYSIRQTALRIGIEPGYLSKIERGEASPPSEAMVRRLAVDLGEDADLLLAIAGKVAGDVREIIMQRPILFAELIRSLGEAPDEELAMLVCRVRNAKWLRKRRALFDYSRVD